MYKYILLFNISLLNISSAASAEVIDMECIGFSYMFTLGSPKISQEQRINITIDECHISEEEAAWFFAVLGVGDLNSLEAKYSDREIGALRKGMENADAVLDRVEERCLKEPTENNDFCIMY
ncbi:hypothetical protein WNZ15_22410 [Roseibium sp. AS2]|uniref:hypothetical protein n=1 Tax=Roseibium sp. AS2 TaxID=3135781 RepID=UPI00316FAD26